VKEFGNKLLTTETPRHRELKRKGVISALLLVNFSAAGKDLAWEESFSPSLLEFEI
jgi:hypothetical protein